MNQTEITILQRKIADYPERIARLQKRQEMIPVPAASEIEPAIRSLGAYIIQLTAVKSSFDKIGAEVRQDEEMLRGYLDEIAGSGQTAPETLRYSLVQLQHILMTTDTHTSSLEELLDSARQAREKLELAGKQKKTLDVVKLLRMIEKGDGYRL
ncbi:hypothetical protein [Butyrivibrio sp. MC2021]|uniref:hypothetical protein n=1 Tax=Butyrivibrio sp. MC2021 TaxID=1408306 RepID=UPI00047D16F6|nr:hypothetical protein [Butyrivibrio sp. MC2021]